MENEKTPIAEAAEGFIKRLAGSNLTEEDKFSLRFDIKLAMAFLVQDAKGNRPYLREEADAIVDEFIKLDHEAFVGKCSANPLAIFSL